MKIVKILLFILFFNLLINSVNALTYSNCKAVSVNMGNSYFDNEFEIFNVTQSNFYTISCNNVSGKDEVRIWIPLTNNSPTIAYVPLNTLYDAVVGADGYLYVATSNGLYKSKQRATSTIYWINDTEHFIQIDNSFVYRLRVDNNYLYLAKTNSLNKMDYSSLSIQYLFDTNFNKFNYEYFRYDFDVTTDYIYYGYVQNNKLYLDKYTKDGTLIDTYISSNCISQYCTSDNDRYVSVIANKNDYIYLKGRLATYSKQYIFNNSIYQKNWISNSVAKGVIGTYTKEGAILQTDYTVITFIPAYNKVPFQFQAPQLTYNQADIFSFYNTYANNSNFEIGYTIDFTLTNDEYDTLKDNYIWKVELLNPDNYKVADYLIQDIDCSGLLSKHCYKNQVIYFSPTQSWENGTYSVYLYEINITTNNKGFLDMDTFEVTNKSMQEGIISNPEYSTMSLSDKVNYLLSNNYLWAIMIIGICVGMLMPYGKSGLLLGSGIGIGFTYLMGFIPTWMLFLFVIIIILVFAMKTSNQFSGSEE